MIDVVSLGRLVGTVALQKGLAYARSGAVSDIAVHEHPLRITGQIEGTAPVPYRADVSIGLSGAVLTSLTGLCSCPVRLNCKHVVALVVTALSSRRPEAGPVRPAWERTLRPLVDSDGPVQSGKAAALGLQFELMAPVEAAAPSFLPGVPLAERLGIRPVQQGTGGRWVRSGIAWSTLGYFGYGYSGADLDHLEWLTAVMALAGGTPRYYGAAPTWIQLGTVRAAAVWDVLARAADVGVALVGSDRTQRPVALSSGKAEVVVDVVREGRDLRLEAVVDLDGQWLRRSECLPLGDPVRGLVTWPAEYTQRPLRDRPLRLGTFRTGPGKDVAALLDAGVQVVPPHDEQRFLSAYLPVLRQRVVIVSGDDSFELPATVPPVLVLTVAHLPGARALLRWGWRYAGADTDERLWPEQYRPAPFRDPQAEAAVLAALPAGVRGQDYLLDAGRLRTEVTLAGMSTVHFLTDVLPLLDGCPGVRVDVTGAASYRPADGAPVIGISGEPAPDRDWFDLQITVTVDGEDVPLREIFLALATAQEFLILPSGTYFRLDTAEFEQLRRLIDEAAQLQDAGTASVRISRFQAGLWEELSRLGVVDEQAAAWHRRIGALTGRAPMERQPVPGRFRAALRPYQQDGYDWLSFLFDSSLGGILADDMGLGKTVQALALICRAVDRPTGSGPFLVVAPTSVVGNWRSEAAAFAPHLKVTAVNETRSRRGTDIAELTADSDVVVTSYALFRLEFAAYQDQEWAGLILDEAQFVKNHQTQGFKNAKTLTAPFKLAITGTPMENNLTELWSLFSIVAPGLFGSPARFTEYYRNPIEKLGESERLAQLRRRIRPLMLRRSKEQVATDLPPKQEQVIELELEARHRRVYQTHLQRERKKVLGLIGDMDKNRFTIFRSLTLLRQLSLDASLVDEKYAGVPSTKLEALMEQLDDVVAEGHRVLVFSQFTSFLRRVRERLEGAGIDYCYLDGSTRRRGDVLARFSAGAAPVFLISLKAGGVGLNLTEADYCILLDPWWNPATEAQAVDRVHRIGQTRTVMVYRLVAKDTIEEKVMALKENKAKLFSSVLGNDTGAATALTAEDIRELLS